jgi:hypothetical protein
MSDVENPVSEGETQPTEAVPEQKEAPEQPVQEERMVPLTALEAERKKRQEAETQAKLYEQYLQQQQAQPQPAPVEDGDDILTKDEYRQNISQAKREILEESFFTSNPEAVKQINEHLPELMKNKPWIKEAVENAPNRWQRAWELVRDFTPQTAPTPQKSQDAQRIVDNAQKPGSPATVGKSATASKVDHMRSMRGTREWDEYRSKLRRGLV